MQETVELKLVFRQRDNNFVKVTQQTRIGGEERHRLAYIWDNFAMVCRAVPYLALPFRNHSRTVPNHSRTVLNHGHTVPYHTTSMPYSEVPYRSRTVLHVSISYRTVPYHTLQYRALQYRTVPYPAIHTVPYCYCAVPYCTLLFLWCTVLQLCIRYRRTVLYCAVPKYMEYLD